MCGPLGSLCMLFNHFITHDYPTVLNHMLLMPLHKDDPVDCSNYQGISLMHPWGCLFSKVIIRCLEADPAVVRTKVQAGFRKHHRVEDNCLIL